MIMTDTEQIAAVHVILENYVRETSHTGVNAIHAVHDIARALDVEMYPANTPPFVPPGAA